MFLSQFLLDEDRCDAAYKIGVCVREAAMSRGLIVDRRK